RRRGPHAWRADALPRDVELEPRRRSRPACRPRTPRRRGPRAWPPRRRVVSTDARPAGGRPAPLARGAPLPDADRRKLRLLRARHRVERGPPAGAPERAAPRPLTPSPRRGRALLRSRRDHSLPTRHAAAAALLARLPVQRPLPALRRLPPH